MGRLAIVFAVLVIGGVLALPAAAITDGQPDNDGHPYVGLMVAQDASGNPLWRCSGTLLSSTVYLTAGHCTEAPAARAEIWFASGPIPTDSNYTSVAAGGTGCANPAVTGYPCHGDTGGIVHTHPSFDPDAFFLFDLGVVTLEKAVVRTTYGALPKLNELDSLKPKRSTTFTAVGYGLQRAFPDAAAAKDEAIKVRLVAHPHLIQINNPGSTGDFSLILSANASTGGTCFGDSGGPNFIGTSNVLAGVTSYGKNPTCAGQGGVYRVDRADDLTWLATFGVTH